MSDPLTGPGGVSDEAAAAERPSLLTSSGPVADVLVVLGCFLVLGLVCGALWWLLVDPAMFTRVKSGGAMDEAQLGKRFNADGWYAVIAGVAGLVTGSVLTWWRSRDFLLTTVLLFVGAVFAAAAMALVGWVLGPPDPTTLLGSAKVGAHFPVQLKVIGNAPYLVWPIGALLGALLVLWSSSRGSERDVPVSDQSWPPPGPGH